jgi:hypothetical protein
VATVYRATSEEERSNLEPKLLKAIRDSQFKWRTVRSLAKELDVPEAKIAEVLPNSESFVMARKPNARGEALFSSSSQYRDQTSLWGRFLGAGANTLIR